MPTTAARDAEGLLQGFLQHWASEVRAGHRSPLDRSEECVLECFRDWLIRQTRTEPEGSDG